MNTRQLQKLGIPGYSLRIAVIAVQQLISQKKLSRSEIKARLSQVVQNPCLFTADPVLDALAKSLQDHRPAAAQPPISCERWGSMIDDATLQQMNAACKIPGAVAAAVMPDAHVGYGLPIGGVLALDNAVVPYAVGVDIACRMKLSVLDTPSESIDNRFVHYRRALEQGTVFGIGGEHKKPQEHPVLDANWNVSDITRRNRDKARRQLGTSGSGNHFVEFGIVTVTERSQELNLEPGLYTGLLSHSGSRGTGASVCSTYSAIARRQMPHKWEHLGHLAWLDMDSHEGQEYWAAMSLMGDYASAGHDVIHRLVVQLLGGEVILAVENHHNFAWKETHRGRETIVHRKGATPAGQGVLGVIPGSMADPAYVVRGLGNTSSLNSAAHGAGRIMSRRAARSRFSYPTVRNTLKKRGIHVLSAGPDEVPGVYKNIEQVMAEQSDLVEPIARFDPKIVRMCGDGTSRPED
ncbi:MAG: RtcB family protein [Fuerstiella sp.]|nr:RtcB family protein [Fuerstiella sp.]